VPINSENNIIFKFCFSFTKLTIAKNKMTAETTGIVWGKEIIDELERYEDSRTATPNAKTGRLRGFLTKVSLFSEILFKQYKSNSRNAPATIRICFGKVKNSVVLVKKIIGNSMTIIAITTVARELIISE